MKANDRAAALEAEVLDEPRMLAALLDAYAAPGGPLAGLPDMPPSSKIVFAGLGSSRYAALDAAAAVRTTGACVWVEFASADLIAPGGRDVTFIAISASGSTPETLAAAERHRGSRLVIAVTNRPDSPLAAAANVVLPLFAGVEASGVSSRTSLATTAVLALLAGQTVDSLRPAVDGLARLLATRADWLRPAADLLDGADEIGVIASARHQGLAGQAALMLREAPRLRAFAHEAEDWDHTAIYTALPGYRALLLPAVPDAERFATVIRGRGGGTVSAPAIAGPVPLVAPAFADLLAAELWRRAGA